jgi:hypothetical protein
MVFFSAAFVDKDGNPASPISATLYLAFTDLNRARQKVNVSMSIAGNVATATWDSSVASDCTVQYSVKGTGSNAIVQDGSFTLLANEANPAS